MNLRQFISWIKDATGFFAYTNQNGDFHKGKTLWDWLELLIIPAVLASAVLFFNHMESLREREFMIERIREETLKSYLDGMEVLLLDRDLLQPNGTSNDAVTDVAQIKTITALRILDENRRDIIFQFLSDAQLNTFILVKANLDGIDLSNNTMRSFNLTRASLESANLQGSILNAAELNEANLRGSNLSGADLRGANLNGATLWGANLNGADLVAAKLNGSSFLDADLSETFLGYADLSGASLMNANLNCASLLGTNLTDAEVLDAQLAQTRTLNGAIMPDGRRHDPNVHVPFNYEGCRGLLDFE